MRFLAIALAAILLAPTVTSTSAEAEWRGKKSKYSKSRPRGKSRSRRSRRSKVRGFTARRGGYSYRSNDVANTYGDSRTRYGSVNSFRDPFSDRQTTAGPFDHGWFFDSAVAPRGGDSPYLQ